MGFKDPITVAKAIEHIQANRYVLPAIQREFVWNARQIEQLFDSLMQQYPIGSFLFWEVKAENLNEYQFYRFMDRYHQRDYRHNEKITLTGPHNVIAVLDGQQRLTALNIGLKGAYATKLPYYRWNNDRAFPPRRLYINLLGPSEDMEFKYEIRMLREEEAKKRDGKFWFPVGQILQFNDLGEIVDYCMDHGLMQGNNKFPHKTLMLLWQVITQQPTITYFLEEEQDLDRVLNIFIRVNSGGTELSYSDMLLSIATAQWQEYDAREEIYKLVDQLNEIGAGFNFNKDFILKASLVLTDVPNIAFRVNNFNKRNMRRIEQQWPLIAGVLQQTVKLLASWGYNRDTLTSNYAVIPLAYYLFTHGITEHFEIKGVYREDREKMVTWLRVALLKRVFSGQPDNVLRKIRDVISHHHDDGFPKDQIIAALAGTTKTMHFDRAQLEGLLGYQYDQGYTFSVLALLYPWLRYDQHFHKDHIYPRSMITEKTLARLGIPPEAWGKWLNNRDSLANLQLLQGLRNIEKSNMMPMDWLRKEYGDDEAQIAAYRERHLIPDIELTLENFPEFIALREKMILEKLSKALGVAGGEDPHR